MMFPCMNQPAIVLLLIAAVARGLLKCFMILNVVYVGTDNTWDFIGWLQQLLCHFVMMRRNLRRNLRTVFKNVRWIRHALQMLAENSPR
jgi:hypothetical protein